VLSEACPEQSEGTHEILHGVYPEPKSETLPLRFTQGQGDTWRRVQNDKHGISLIATQFPGERDSIGIIWLENKIFNPKKCRGASLGAPDPSTNSGGGHRGPSLRINKSIFMVVGDPSGS